MHVKQLPHLIRSLMYVCFEFLESVLNAIPCKISEFLVHNAFNPLLCKCARLHFGILVHKARASGDLDDDFQSGHSPSSTAA